MFSKCAYSTVDSRNLKRHIQNIHSAFKAIDENVEIANHSCNQCDYKTYSERGLKYHVGLAHRKEYEFKCEKCEYSCDSESKLDCHIKRKHNVHLPYSCDICSKKFKYKVNLNHHTKRQHGSLEFTCEFCDLKTKFKHALQEHINSQHTQQIKFECTLCDHYSYSKTHLLSHIKNVHNNSEDLKKFHCDECPFKAKSKDKLKDHFSRVHNNKKLYKCDLCDYRGKVPRDVSLHKKVHDTDNTSKHKCTECEYETVWQSNLNRHFKRTHENIKAFKCDACDQSFTVKNSLVKHQYTVHGIDIGLTKFHCSFDNCGYETIHKQVLKNHISANHETKPEKCSICHQMLKNSLTLKNHIERMHSKEKKVYECLACSKQYFKLLSLKEHLNVIHGEGEKETFNCEYCNYFTLRKRNLKRHNCYRK